VGSGSGSGAGLSPCNLACLRALVAAAMFLAPKLGPSWFAVPDVLQNADHVLTTRGTTPPGSAVLSHNANATSSTPSERGAALAEGPVSVGHQQPHRQ